MEFNVSSRYGPTGEARLRVVYRTKEMARKELQHLACKLENTSGGKASTHWARAGFTMEELHERGC